MNRLLKRMLVIFLASAAGLYVVIVGFFATQQRALLFPRPALFSKPGVEGGKVVELKDAGGKPVVVLHVPAAAEKPTVVYFHGNAETLESGERLARRLAKLGVGCLAVEYPGYGVAPGEPTEAGIYAAAEAGLAWLRDSQKVAPEQTLLFGRSLGTGVAAEMAKRGYGSRLVLVTPYTSIPDMANALLPFLPARLLVLDRFDTASKAAGLKLPVLIVHGDEDEVVPTRMGEALAKVFPNARLVVVKGARHNDVLELFPEVWARDLEPFVLAR